jgi:hypothetical protein
MNYSISERQGDRSLISTERQGINNAREKERGPMSRFYCSAVYRVFWGALTAASWDAFPYPDVMMLKGVEQLKIIGELGRNETFGWRFGVVWRACWTIAPNKVKIGNEWRSVDGAYEC